MIMKFVICFCKVYYEMMMNWWGKWYLMIKILECISPGLPGAGRSTHRASTTKNLQFSSQESADVMKGRGRKRGVLAVFGQWEAGIVVCSLCLATAVKISCNDRWGDIYDVRFILLFPSQISCLLACFLFVRSNSGGTNVLFDQKNKEMCFTISKATINFIHLFPFFFVCFYFNEALDIIKFSHIFEIHQWDITKLIWKNANSTKNSMLHWKKL